jgi:hypothetical protein
MKFNQQSLLVLLQITHYVLDGLSGGSPKTLTRAWNQRERGMCVRVAKCYAALALNFFL